MLIRSKAWQTLIYMRPYGFPHAQRTCDDHNSQQSTEQRANIFLYRLIRYTQDMEIKLLFIDYAVYRLIRYTQDMEIKLLLIDCTVQLLQVCKGRNNCIRCVLTNIKGASIQQQFSKDTSKSKTRSLLARIPSNYTSCFLSYFPQCASLPQHSFSPWPLASNPPPSRPGRNSSELLTHSQTGTVTREGEELPFSPRTDRTSLRRGSRPSGLTSRNALVSLYMTLFHHCW